MTSEEQNLALERIYTKSKEEADYSEPIALDDEKLSGGLEFTGSVSLRDRIERGEVTIEQVKQAVEIMSECYVEVSPSARMRCGDDRPALALNELLSLSYFELATREVGPQAMGAAQSYATAYRIVSVPDEKATMIEDIKTVKPAIEATGVKPGLHTDQKCSEKADGSVGCGAVMNHGNGVDAYEDPKNDAGLSVLAGNIMGNSYNPRIRPEHSANAAEIKKIDYLNSPAKLLEEFEAMEGPGATETVHDVHLAGIVGVNTVPGTTFQRELYIRRCLDEIGVRIDAFNVDVWEAPRVAAQLYPGDRSMVDSYLTAWADWQARPAAFITDGSQYVVVRTPKDLNIAA